MILRQTTICNHVSGLRVTILVQCQPRQGRHHRRQVHPHAFQITWPSYPGSSHATRLITSTQSTVAYTANLTIGPSEPDVLIPDHTRYSTPSVVDEHVGRRQSTSVLLAADPGAAGLGSSRNQSASLERCHQTPHAGACWSPHLDSRRRRPLGRTSVT